MMTKMKTTRKMKTVITNARPARRSVLVFALLFACSTACFAADPSAAQQDASSTSKSHLKPYALIFATVWNADSTPAYGVTVTLRRTDQKKPKWSQMSNHSGEVAFRVPAGKADYILEADVKSSNSKTKPEVKVHIENDERIDTGIHLIK
jgi:hypothetical protein